MEPAKRRPDRLAVARLALGEIQVAQKRIEGPLIARLGEIIEELGKSQGFTLIIRRGAPGVLYSREALDITDLVIEKYNAKS